MGYPIKPDSLNSRIIAACDGKRGASMREIVQATGGHPPSVAAQTPVLVKKRRLHRVGTRMVRRYFAQLEHAQAYKLVFAQERAAAIVAKQQRRRANYNAKKAAERKAAGLPPPRPKAPPKPKKQRQQPARGRGASIRLGTKDVTASIAEATTVTWPAHVKVQRAPTPVDDRFAFIPPPWWQGELTQEWMDKRKTA